MASTFLLTVFVLLSSATCVVFAGRVDRNVEFPDFCGEIQSHLPDRCSCISLQYGAKIGCDINFFGVDTIGITATLDVCDVPATADIRVNDTKIGIDHEIAGLTAGKAIDIPIPGLSLSIPKIGSVGVNAVFDIEGDLEALDVKLGIDACGKVLGIQLCGEKLTKELPIYVLDHTFNFGSLCANATQNVRPREEESPPTPSAGQLRTMDFGLAQFMHFSVDPWSSIEHNCVGTSPECIPASKFNPTNLSTDQWVETAVAFGASEICLTAHHEGGFCLWDTNYSNYSVMHSPYGKDIVKEFVESCSKYGVKPCYYMGPNANGWLANNLSYTAEQFVDAQLGMLRELLTSYGDDYVSRLWWDHYPSGCGNLAPCPSGSFPDAWPRFVRLVREVSPSTIICPGPDCDGHQGESGIGVYPAWYNCDMEMENGTELKCENHSANSGHDGFHPYEACATMHNGWFCKGDGSDDTNTYWTAGEIWDHYMQSVGIGWINTLNAPPCTSGQINQRLVSEMRTFGSSLKSLLTVIASADDDNSKALSAPCDGKSVVAEISDLGDEKFNAIILREDLTKGQNIRSYAIDRYDGNTWSTYPDLNPSTNLTLGQSVGSQLIHFVQEDSTTQKVRVRCLEGISGDGSLAVLKSLSAHFGQRPAE